MGTAAHLQALRISLHACSATQLALPPQPTSSWYRCRQRCVRRSHTYTAGAKAKAREHLKRQAKCGLGLQPQRARGSTAGQGSGSRGLCHAMDAEACKHTPSHAPVPSPPLVSSCVPSAVKAPVRAVPFIFSVPTICRRKQRRVESKTQLPCMPAQPSGAAGCVWHKHSRMHTWRQPRYRPPAWCAG